MEEPGAVIFMEGKMELKFGRKKQGRDLFQVQLGSCYVKVPFANNQNSSRLTSHCENLCKLGSKMEVVARVVQGLHHRLLFPFDKMIIPASG